MQEMGQDAGDAPGAPVAAWAAPRTAAVLAWVEAFVARQARSADQQALLARALVGLQTKAAQHPLFLPVQLPLLVYEGISGEHAPAVPLAGATALLWLGIDILDDQADGDVPPQWTGQPAPLVTLAAAGLLAALAPLALAALDVPPARLAALHTTLADALLRLGAGQQGDLSLMARAEFSAAEVLAAREANSGALGALFAALAAVAAAAPAERVAHCTALGQALSMAGVLLNDCRDLLGGAPSRDLASGARTLPIALYLDGLAPAAREEALALLARAREEPAAHAAVCDRLLTADVLPCCLLVIEGYAARARAALAAAALGEPARSRLAAFIDAWSLTGGPYGAR